MSVFTAWLSLAFFNLSMLSGIIVAFIYKPWISFESVQKLTYLVPYGKFFRELHYFSSELFLIVTLLHIILEILKKRVKITALSWNYSIIAFLLLFFLMFTGYVIKGDLSGLSAGEVSLTIVKETPILKDFLFFIEDEVDFFWKFYIWHIIFLPVLITYFVYVHTKKLTTKYITIAIGITFLAMAIFSMPKDVFPYDNIATIHVTGPWFFRGAENLLKIGIDTILVDLVLFCLFLLLVMYYYMQKYRNILLILLLIWTLFYAYISFI